jgi:hypothetical protein|tara:strand:- start:149 stop:457 length:309 start_codon:yes stop_codon:yes gene_type:complete
MGILDNMKQAKDMYSNMKKAQQEIEKIEIAGQSANGSVTVSINGNHMITNIQIDESIKNGNHQNMEKLIIAACNDAMVKVEKEIKRKVGSMMNLPSGFKLPF